jgi:hypothetical protein
MIIYVENPKDSTKTLLEPITVTKSAHKKSVAFLYV